MAELRAVLDTNVVLSALVFTSGRLTPLRTGWRNGRFRPLVSKDTATELMRALAYPKLKLTREEQQELLADYLPYCETVRIPARGVPVPVCRDPADRCFLVLAAVGKARVLVTGDQDLLAIQPLPDFVTSTPGSFLAGLGTA